MATGRLNAIWTSTVDDHRVKVAGGVAAPPPVILDDAVGAVVAVPGPGTKGWMMMGPVGGMNRPARHMMMKIVEIVMPMGMAK